MARRDDANKQGGRRAGARSTPTSRKTGSGQDWGDKPRGDKDGGVKGRAKRTESDKAPAGHRYDPPKRSRAGGHRTPASPPGLDTIYGFHAGEAALANPARTIRRIWASQGAAGRIAMPTNRADLLALLEVVAADALDARVPGGAVHQGLVVLAEPLVPHDLSDVAAMRRVAVLDQVTDPHNLGAILRSAAAFGIDAVIATERHAPATTGLVAKTASGALERVPIIRATNLARAIDTIRAYGFFCVGLAGETETDLETAIGGAPRLALVLGAEGPGLRRLTRERCDALARIPMVAGTESLNVSNAAAIAFYLASRTAGD